jgi:hypothetical protein
VEVAMLSKLAVVGVVVAGAAIWRRLRRRRRDALHAPGERIRNPGRLVAGGGVRRMD